MMLSVSTLRGPGNRCRDVYRMPEPADCVWVGPQRVPAEPDESVLGKVKRLGASKQKKAQKGKKVQKKMDNYFKRRGSK